MGLAIDWGTFLVSIPVVVTAALGAGKFIAKTYFEKHIDEKFESYKAELQKDMNAHKIQIEKERDEDAKKFEYKLKVSTAYNDARYERLVEIRELIQNAYFFVSENTASEEALSNKVEQEIQKYLEKNLMYFEDSYIDIIQQFAEKLTETREYKRNANRSRSIPPDYDKAWLLYEKSIQSEVELKSLYRNIEKTFQRDFTKAL